MRHLHHVLKMISELLVVLLVALLVLGPQQMHQTAFRLGQWLRRWQKFKQAWYYHLQQFQLHAELAENNQRAQAAEKMQASPVQESQEQEFKRERNR